VQRLAAAQARQARVALWTGALVGIALRLLLAG
jgi:hypothetical protein